MDPYYESRYQPSAPPHPPVYGTAKDFSEKERDRKEELLIARERELERREAELREREARLGTASNTTPLQPRGREPNFPILVPIIYHDIRRDILERRARWTVRVAFLTWFAIPLCLIWNLVCVIGTLVELGDIYTSDVVLASVYFFTLPLFTFTVYRLLYHAARKQRTSLYLLYIFWLFVQIVIMIFFAVGLRGSGAAGFLTVLRLFQDNHLIVGVFCIVMLSVWTILAMVHIGLLLLAILALRALLQAQKTETTRHTTPTYSVE